MPKQRKNTIFTSTESMAAAKAKAKRAGFSIKGSAEVAFGNSAGFVVYAQPKKRR